MNLHAKKKKKKTLPIRTGLALEIFSETIPYQIKVTVFLLQVLQQDGVHPIYYVALFVGKT